MSYFEKQHGRQWFSKGTYTLMGTATEFSELGNMTGLDTYIRWVGAGTDYPIIYCKVMDDELGFINRRRCFYPNSRKGGKILEILTENKVFP